MRLVEDSGGPESNEIERLSQSISFSTGVTPINSASSNRLREFLSSRSEVPHYTAIPSKPFHIISFISWNSHHLVSVSGDLTEAKIPAYKRVKELQQQLLKQKEMAKVQPPIVQPSPVVTQITKAEIITKAPAVPSAIMAQGEKPVTPQLVGGFNLKPSEKPLVPATTLNVGGNKLPPVSVTSAISKSDSPLTALQQMTQSSGLFGKSTETTNKLTTPAPSLFGMNSNPTTPSLFSFQPKTTVPAAIETTTPTTMSESTGLMSFSFKPTMTEKPAVKPAADVPPTLFGRPALETMTKTGENLGTIAKSPELKEKVAEAKPLEVKELPKTPSVTPSPITQPSSALPILPSATVSAPTPTLPQPQKTVSAAPVNLELQPKAVTSASTDMTIKSTTVVTAAEKASFPTVVTTSLTTSAPVISTVTPAPISSIFGASVTQPSSLFAPAAQSTPISPAVKPSEPVTAQPATLEDGEMEEVKVRSRICCNLLNIQEAWEFQENGGTPAVTTQSSALSSFSFKSPTAPPTSTTPQSIFGPPATTAAAGGFGGAAAFGGFGLGGQPNPQNLNKNPFGSAAGGLFGSGTSSTQAQSKGEAD